MSTGGEFESILGARRGALRGFSITAQSPAAPVSVRRCSIGQLSRLNGWSRSPMLSIGSPYREHWSPDMHQYDAHKPGVGELRSVEESICRFAHGESSRAEVYSKLPLA